MPPPAAICPIGNEPKSKQQEEQLCIVVSISASSFFISAIKKTLPLCVRFTLVLYSVAMWVLKFRN